LVERGKDTDKNPLAKKFFAVDIVLVFIGTCIIPAIAQDSEKPSLPTLRNNCLYVGGGGPGNYTKIQDAIDNASSNDNIFVYRGTYLENIFINNTLNLIGEDKNRTIIDGNAKHDVIYIGFPANNVKITGFTIRNSGNFSSGGGYADAGIEIHSDFNMIQNNIISNHPLYGIWLWGSRGNNISYNSILGCDISGIEFLAGPCNILSHNLLYKNGFGINMRLSSNTSGTFLSYNTFLENRFGLWIYASGSDIVCNNFINNYGLNAVCRMNFRRMTPSRNSWARNYWDDWDGVGPKWIPGVFGFNFDWNPVQEPYPYQMIPPLNDQCNPDGVATKWAVVIACSGGFTYERHERCDRNDVRELTQLLKKNGWDENHILTLQEEEATKEAILNDSFQWLKNNGEDEDDLIFYFFSGHGYYHTADDPPVDEPDGRDEVINPWDPDIDGWNPDVFIVDDELSEKFDTLKSNNIVIVIHTCHAGGWIDGAHDLCDSGRVVLVACGVDETSCMMKYPVHWLFAYYLIQGLKGHADENNDKRITAEELLRYTIEPVQFRSKIFNWITSGVATIQHPQMYDGWPSKENNTEELTLIELS
jgi:parallel beta-helix repeat protein